MDIKILLAFGFGLLLIYILGKAMMFPFKLVMKFIINAIVGGVVLSIVNYLGSYINFHIPINPITALVVGFLGIPGLVVLIVIQQLIR